MKKFQLIITLLNQLPFKSKILRNWFPRNIRLILNYWLRFLFCYLFYHKWAVSSGTCQGRSRSKFGFHKTLRTWLVSDWDCCSSVVVFPSILLLQKSEFFLNPGQTSSLYLSEKITRKLNFSRYPLDTLVQFCIIFEHIFILLFLGIRYFSFQFKV